MALDTGFHSASPSRTLPNSLEERGPDNWVIARSLLSIGSTKGAFVRKPQIMAPMLMLADKNEVDYLEASYFNDPLTYQVQLEAPVSPRKTFRTLSRALPTNPPAFQVYPAISGPKIHQRNGFGEKNPQALAYEPSGLHLWPSSMYKTKNAQTTGYWLPRTQATCMLVPSKTHPRSRAFMAPNFFNSSE